MKKYLIFSAILVVVVIVVYVLYANLWFGKLVSESDGTFIGKEEYWKGTEYKLRPGNYTIKLYDPLKEPETKNISVSPFTTTTVDNNNPDQSAPKILLRAKTFIPDYCSIADYKFFLDNKWLVIKVQNNLPDRDGYYIILRYTNHDWTIYSDGTGISSDALMSIDNEMYNYVIGK